MPKLVTAQSDFQEPAKIIPISSRRKHPLVHGRVIKVEKHPPMQADSKQDTSVDKDLKSELLKILIMVPVAYGMFHIVKAVRNKIQQYTGLDFVQINVIISSVDSLKCAHQQYKQGRIKNASALAACGLVGAAISANNIFFNKA